MVHSSLEEAFRVIKGANSQVKHVILCADACDSEEQEGAVELGQTMAKANITISVIGFGSQHDPDVGFQQKLADAGKGHWYLTERLSNLPQVFSRDVLSSSRSLLVEKPFHVIPDNDGHPTTRGVPWAGRPAADSGISASRRRRRRSPSSSSRHPSTATPSWRTWTYGLGHSLAFTSDATAHWGAQWLGWDGYTPFWSQALRWTLRAAPRGNFQTTVLEDGGRATIQVDAVTAEGEYRNLLDLRAHISHVNPDALQGHETTEQVLTLEQTAPGHYRGRLRCPQRGHLRHRRGGAPSTTRPSPCSSPRWSSPTRRNTRPCSRTSR